MLCSLTNLFDRELWRDFLTELEQVVSSKLSHIDTNDPVRKKVESIEDAASFICDIGESENSRTIFAKFSNIKVEMTIILFRDSENFANNISIYFPEKILDSGEGVSVLDRAFRMANRGLQPFYSVCDRMAAISGKRKLSRFAVNLQAELIGIFWLTYLNKSYVDYFGGERFDGLPCKKIDGLDGVLIELGRTPADVSVSREEAERMLGEDSFVDPSRADDKPIGRYALRFDKLLKLESTV